MQSETVYTVSNSLINYLYFKPSTVKPGCLELGYVVSMETLEWKFGLFKVAYS